MRIRISGFGLHLPYGQDKGTQGGADEVIHTRVYPVTGKGCNGRSRAILRLQASVCSAFSMASLNSVGVASPPVTRMFA